MASKPTEELNKLYLEWVAALQANPGMPLDELRHMFEQWERITGEPGAVDYIETDAGGSSGDVGGAKGLRPGPRAAVRAWWRLCGRLDVYSPQDLRSCG